MAKNSVIHDWHEEIDESILTSKSLCFALFSVDRDVIFVNSAMSVFFNTKTTDSFINPTFDQVLELNHSKPLIFEGFLTLDVGSTVNSSIWVRIFRKENRILVIGGADTGNLIEQNKSMHQLNREISQLHRQLIKEKHALQLTLDQLNKANNSLTEINKSKDRFISILAHDLKTPIFSILGYLNLLSKNIYNYSIDKIEKQVGIIYNSTNYTYKLLEDILLWAKAESGNIEFKPQKHLFSEICSPVIEALNHVAKKKGVIINYIPSVDIYVFADKNMISTVLRNLISNAIKFTENNGMINVFVEKNKTELIITVSDNGVGIPEQILVKLFDISYKVTTEGTDQEKGTGLGLLLCKEFVEKHGGKIWVESELTKGANFKFTIPAINEDKI